MSISHRELHKLLLDTVAERLGPDAIVRGLKSSTYTQDAKGGVVLQLLDAQTRKPVDPMHCDILIAADGIYSPLRKTMHPKDGEVSRSGLTVFRGVAPFPRFLDGATMAAIGDHRQKIVCYPVAELPESSASGSNTQMMNFAAVVVEEPQDIKVGQQSYTEAADPKEVLRRLDAGEFGAYNLPWLDHRAMFHAAEALYSWPIVDRDPLDSWVDGCVALIGDAAHPMYPFGSNGASSALLDAKELAEQMTSTGALGTRDREVLRKALLGYQSVRLPAAVAVQAACRNQGAEKVVAQYSRSKAEKGSTGKDEGKGEGDTGKLVREALAKAQRGADVKAKVAEDVQGEDHKYEQLLDGFTADEKAVLLAKKGLKELLSAPGGKGEVRAVTERVLPRTGANSEQRVFDLEVKAVVEQGGAKRQKRSAKGGQQAVVAVSRSAVVVKDQAKAMQMMAEGMLGLQEDDGQTTFKIRSLARGTSKATGQPCIVRQYELSNDAMTCQTYEEIATDAVPPTLRRSKRARPS